MNTQNINDNWIEFCHSFITFVELGCIEMQNNKNSASQKRRLKIAVVYNMKHVIEIIIKSFIRLLDEDKIEEIKKHDLDWLFEKLEKKISQKTFNVHHKELKYYQKQEEQKWKKEYLAEIREIVDYYNQLKFLKNAKYKIFDTNNTAFKYPENDIKVSLEIDYFDFIYDNSLDVEQIGEHATKLHFLLNSMKTITWKSPTKRS